MPTLKDSWPGSNRFMCGCTIAGPISDCAANACWYVCALVALVMISIFVTANAWNVTPALPIFFYLTIALTTLFLNLTGCTDPGIIPRRPYIEREQKKYKPSE